MVLVMASDGLAPWGQAAAIILALYIFLSVIVSLALAAVLMFGFAWIREKAELLRQLRPQINELNHATVAAKQGAGLPPEVATNKVISTIAQVPRMAENAAATAGRLEQSVDQGSARVANTVIELHARTAMVKGMARAFFLPGLAKKRPIAPVAQTMPQEQEAAAAATAQDHDEEPPMEIVITQSSR